MNNKLDILNELKVLSTTLFRLKEKEVLPMVPTNYFVDLAESIIAQTQNENGFLSTIKKEVDVPTDYFNSFADNVLSKIKEEENVISEGKIIALQPQKKNNVVKLFSHVAIVASVVGVLFFGIKNYNQTNVINNCEDGIACLTPNEIYNYMHENSEQFELQQVQEAVAPAIENATIKMDLEKNEIEKYIEQNKTDLSVEDASTAIF